MRDATARTASHGPNRSDDRLFLTERKLREAAELMFFAYRYFTKDPDEILAEKDYGRAHHRALHFIGREPGISVAGLLDILGITKQSLARVLKPLIEEGLVEARTGVEDRRQRLLTLTEEGAMFEQRLSRVQRERMIRAFREAGPEAVAGYRTVMALLIDEEKRDGVLNSLSTRKEGAE